MKKSELILNPNGSVYHCNLMPNELADTIILVGDPDRVATVAQHFDRIECQNRKREIVSATGWYKNKRLTAISTGMGTDNIDIVLTELDALKNVDLNTRTPKESFTPLTFLRLGTSGALQADTPVDSFMLSEQGLGLDGLVYAYKDYEQFIGSNFLKDFTCYTSWNPLAAQPYLANGSAALLQHFKTPATHSGITATAIGFYGPQGRVVRLPVADPNLMDKVSSFTYQGKKITNFEMETSAIYALSQLMGHTALSLNCIIANRATGDFSDNPYQKIEEMIVFALNKLSQLP